MLLDVWAPVFAGLPPLPARKKLAKESGKVKEEASEGG
jgi:hypothetical protein